MKSKVTLLSAAMFAMLCLTGCGVLTTKVAPKVAAAVTLYCAEPQAERLLLRGQVAAAVAPNAVQVTCANDPK